MVDVRACKSMRGVAGVGLLVSLVYDGRAVSTGRFLGSCTGVARTFAAAP
jgi:hypothetical protein